MKTAIGRPLDTVDQNHARQTTSLQESPDMMGLQAAEMVRMRQVELPFKGKAQETKAHCQQLNTSIVSCERQLAFHKEQLKVLESVVGNRLTVAVTRLPEEAKILHHEVTRIKEEVKRLGEDARKTEPSFQEITC